VLINPAAAAATAAIAVAKPARIPLIELKYSAAGKYNYYRCSGGI
jgi:hypothetical protein